MRNYLLVLCLLASISISAENTAEPTLLCKTIQRECIARRPEGESPLGSAACPKQEPSRCVVFQPKVLCFRFFYLSLTSSKILSFKKIQIKFGFLLTYSYLCPVNTKL